MHLLEPATPQQAHRRRQWHPTPGLSPGESQGRGAWWAAVHGVSKSRTRRSDFISLFTRWRRKWQPTPVFLPGESQGPGARWTAVYGVAQGRTRLNRLAAAATLRHGPLSWPCSWPQRPDLHVTAGASSQGTDSEPRPPGLLLRVKLHPGPSTPNWRVKGSGGHQSPPSSQKERRGGAPEPTPCTPPALLSLRPLLLISAHSLPSRSPHSRLSFQSWASLFLQTSSDRVGL